MVNAICSELNLQKDFLPNEVETIYFGGGTPSLLSDLELGQILEAVHQSFAVSQSAEITLEGNPDDLSAQKLKALQNVGVNRLSIGVQSFHDASLQFMNRAHNSQEALSCIQDAQDLGLDNISIDLIYGVPNGDELTEGMYAHELWQADMEQAIALNSKHISAYCLTIEPQTVFGKWQKNGKLPNIQEEYAAQQFEMLIDFLGTNNFEQYEISNFCKSGFESRHNASYWQQKPYLGIGPSAHSFNGKVRQFNVRNNAHYLRSIGQSQIPAEIDMLSKEDTINEYILTALRTKWGADLTYLKQELGCDLTESRGEAINFQLEQEALELLDGKLRLTRKGKLLADFIAQKLFV